MSIDSVSKEPRSFLIEVSGKKHQKVSAEWVKNPKKAKKNGNVEFNEEFYELLKAPVERLLLEEKIEKGRTFRVIAVSPPGRCTPVSPEHHAVSPSPRRCTPVSPEHHRNASSPFVEEVKQ